MSDLSRLQDTWNDSQDDDGGDCCQACGGRGGNTSRQDPVGDGVGFETLFDPCPDCIGRGKCPGCMGPIVEWDCQNGCGWTSDDIDSYGNEPSWGDYPDDDDLPY